MFARSLRALARPVAAAAKSGAAPCRPMASTVAPAVQSSTVSDLSSNYREKHNDVIASGDPSRRAFTYFITGGARFVYASLGRLAVLKFVSSMNASADVLALASVEVDISNMEPGQMVTIKWRGKPVFVKNRTEKEIEAANAVDMGSLRDPQTDGERVQNPSFLVALGVCTHLGCVPLGNAGDFEGGYFCPCHGSHYDSSARIRKGPAPLNLEIPPYKFIEDDSKLLIG